MFWVDLFVSEYFFYNICDHFTIWLISIFHKSWTPWGFFNYFASPKTFIFLLLIDCVLSSWWNMFGVIGPFHPSFRFLTILDRLSIDHGHLSNPIKYVATMERCVPFLEYHLLCNLSYETPDITCIITKTFMCVTLRWIYPSHLPNNVSPLLFLSTSLTSSSLVYIFLLKGIINTIVNLNLILNV